VLVGAGGDRCGGAGGGGAAAAPAAAADLGSSTVHTARAAGGLGPVVHRLGAPVAANAAAAAAAMSAAFHGPAACTGPLPA